MSWLDICSWTSTWGRKKQPEISKVPTATSPRKKHQGKTAAGYYNPSTMSLNKEKIVTKQPARPAPIIVDRDLPPVPPVPPIPPSVYEMGLATPRTGLTRSNSRASVRTTASTKSRKRTATGRRPTIGTPSDFRKVEGAMPHTDISGFRGVELGGDIPKPEPTLAARFKPLELSIHQTEGRLSPMPSFSEPFKPRTYDRPVRQSSLADLHRRSMSAPIPVRSLSTYSIPRKPITPKNSISFSRPGTSSTMRPETSDSLKQAIEADEYTHVELSAESSRSRRSRSQSYYVEASATVISTMSDVKPPVPLKIPAKLPASVASVPISTTDRSPISPDTTSLANSPLPLEIPEDTVISPISPPPRRSQSIKRSKSVGPFPMPPKHQRPKLDRLSTETTLPTLPAAVYTPISSHRSRSFSAAKTATTAPSSRRSSSSSLASTASNTSCSSQTSNRMRSSKMQKPLVMTDEKYITISIEHKPAEGLRRTPSSTRMARRSATAPIPVVSIPPTSTMPTIPTQISTPVQLPAPMAVPISTSDAKNKIHELSRSRSKSRGRAPITRSTSTENISTRSSTRNASTINNLKRSKSTYEASMAWGEVIRVKPLNVVKKELNTTSAAAAPVEVDTEMGIAISLPIPVDSEKATLVMNRAPKETNTAQEEKLDKNWGKGMGAEWGVGY
jgi:hypothetical protein